MSEQHRPHLELMLFESDAERACDLKRRGVDTILVDRESRGKERRQRGFDTEIAPATREELCRVARISGAETWCRLNRYGPWTAREIEEALACGIRGLFLPMVTTVAEAEAFVRLIDRRCEAGILIETVAAAASAEALGRLPLQRIYFGLNDFTIDRGDRCLFQPLYDGTVERVRDALDNRIRFGFGGATVVEGGAPVPARRLLEEMARLGCSFTFLRRSFKRDLAHHPPESILDGIRSLWKELVHRSPEEERRDHRELLHILERLC